MEYIKLGLGKYDRMVEQIENLKNDLKASIDVLSKKSDWVAVGQVEKVENYHSDTKKIVEIQLYTHDELMTGLYKKNLLLVSHNNELNEENSNLKKEIEALKTKSNPLKLLFSRK